MISWLRPPPAICAGPYDYGFASRQSAGWQLVHRPDTGALTGCTPMQSLSGWLRSRKRFSSDQSVERRSSGALSALAGSDLACSAFGSDFTGSSLALSTAGVSTRAVTSARASAERDGS